MKKIRNARDVRLSVPSLHLETDPGDIERIPDDAQIPDGYEPAAADPKPAPARGKAKTPETPAPAAAPADTKEND